jgi:hypothetical protein
MVPCFFSNDFESGDLKHTSTSDWTKWNGANAGQNDSVSISNERARSGAYALKYFFRRQYRPPS